MLCAKNGSRQLAVFEGCPAGYFQASLPAGTVLGAPAAGEAAAVKIVHKQVTVNADYQAGTLAERTVTFTGLPAYKSSGSAEISGSNVDGLPDAVMGSVTVAPTTPTNGQTTRSFVVTPAGFNGSESYTLDLWILSTN